MCSLKSAGGQQKDPKLIELCPLGRLQGHGMSHLHLECLCDMRLPSLPPFPARVRFQSFFQIKNP